MAERAFGPAKAVIERSDMYPGDADLGRFDTKSVNVNMIFRTVAKRLSKPS